MIHQRLSATFGINSMFTEEVYIGEARKVALEIQTYALGLITATANIYALVAHSDTDTFRRAVAMGVYSASSGLYDWEIPSGSGGRTTICPPALGFNYLQIETSKTATAALTCYVHIFR